MPSQICVFSSRIGSDRKTSQSLVSKQAGQGQERNFIKSKVSIPVNVTNSVPILKVQGSKLIARHYAAPREIFSALQLKCTFFRKKNALEQKLLKLMFPICLKSNIQISSHLRGFHYCS